MARRLCNSALKGKCAFGNVDGSCDKLDEFVLKYCKKGSIDHSNDIPLAA